MNSGNISNMRNESGLSLLGKRKSSNSILNPRGNDSTHKPFVQPSNIRSTAQKFSRNGDNLKLIGNVLVDTKKLMKNASMFNSRKTGASNVRLSSHTRLSTDQGNAKNEEILKKREELKRKKQMESKKEQEKENNLLAEVEALLATKSLNADGAEDEWFESYSRRMDKLSKREYAQQMASNIHQINIQAFQCIHPDCGGPTKGRLTEQFPSVCGQKGHQVMKIPVVKRFFECACCRRRESVLKAKSEIVVKVILPPDQRCSCGQFRWVSCGRQGSGPLSVGPSVANTGEVKVGVSSSGGGLTAGLVLSASDWTSQQDKVSIAERVSRL